MGKYEKALWDGLRNLLVARIGYAGPLDTPAQIRAAWDEFNEAAQDYPLCVVCAFLSGEARGGA